LAQLEMRDLVERDEGYGRRRKTSISSMRTIRGIRSWWMRMGISRPSSTGVGMVSSRPRTFVPTIRVRAHTTTQADAFAAPFALFDVESFYTG